VNGHVRPVVLSAAAAALAVAFMGRANPPARAAAEARTTRLYRDGHSRPRALAFNPDDGLLYVALSTADAVAVVDWRQPRRIATVAACAFPDALAPLPGGGALVSCRFDPSLRRIRRDAAGRFTADAIASDSVSGARGLAVAPDGRVAYVASPARGGIVVVSLAGEGVVQTVRTGLSPRAVRVVPADTWPGQHAAWLVTSAFVEHLVTVHAIGPDDRIGPPVESIRTAAPVLDMAATGGDAPALLLATHEDRAVSRAHGPVEGLDSVVLRLGLRRATAAIAGPIEDPGPGRRDALNLGERAAPVIELASAAAAGGWIALTGAGSDNLLVARASDRGLARATAVEVGANPSAVAPLPGGRFVTADRLSDTLTFVSTKGDRPRVETTLIVGEPERGSAAERGELLFFSRRLVPNNVADGPLSLYTCAACHDDGGTDGRLHPAKQNRFFSTTTTCRGLGNTAPYLRLGDQATIDAFADNIVATHAQGAERDAAGFDRYPVDLRLRDARGWTIATLSPLEVRAALARYLERIPTEPSPFVPMAATALPSAARRGLEVFRDGCATCHRLVEDSAAAAEVPEGEVERRLLAGQLALTSPRLYDVGTPVLGSGGNNPPSLRGVWGAAPYFNDGSARSLEEVLARTDPNAPRVHGPENARRSAAMSAGDRAALLAFLRAL
jgi:hypothetical protein